MKWIVWIGVALLWAQVESRSRTSEPPPPKPKPAASPREVVVELSYVTISGKIVDANDDALAEAKIQILNQKSGQIITEAETDKRGRFGVAVPKVQQVILRITKGDKTQEQSYSLEELQDEDLEIRFAPN